MRVLFITNHFLDGNSGGAFASCAFINAFVEIADNVVLLYPDRGKEILPLISDKIVKRGIRNDKSNFVKLVDIYRGRIHRFHNNALTEIKKNRPDVVVFDNSRSSAGLVRKIMGLGIKMITIHHNYEMEYYKGSPPSILWRAPFLYYMKKAEKTAIKFSNLNLTLTDQDTSLLRRHYDKSGNAKFKKIGCFEANKEKDDANKELIKEKCDGLNFVITGSLSSYQTEYSLIPFLESFYPIILKQYPDSRLIIAGKNPSFRIIGACEKYSKIDLIPNPENIQAIISKASIYICPTSVGGGMKLRIMDGLKMGMPVLTHIVSERGYEEFKKEGVLFSYSDINSFEINLCKLIGKYNLGQVSKIKIKEIYHSIFSFSVGVSRLKILLSKYEFYH